MSQGEQQTLTKALIIDDDELVVNQTKSFLVAQGIEDIEQAQDGSVAWEMLQAAAYDLIVLDWKLPRVGGLTLFNRIRRHPQLSMTPILVISGFLQKNDFRLLAEFPVTRLLEKPFTANKLQLEYQNLLNEQYWYYENDNDIQFILQTEDDPKAILSKLQGMFKDAPNAVPLALLAAKKLVAGGYEKLAVGLYKQILTLDSECVWAMNELGKLYHRAGKPEQAMDVLRQATRLSPQNLARLCLMGEVELGQKNPESAKQMFDEVLEIDPEDKVAESGKVVAESLGDVIQQFGKDRMTHSFGSILNTIGIAMIKGGKYQKGIEQYKSALPFLRVKEDTAKLAFNLGLGYLRWGKPQQALPWFEKLATDSNKIGSKSKEYVQKIVDRTGIQPTSVNADEVLEMEDLQHAQGQAAAPSQHEVAKPLEKMVAPSILGDNHESTAPPVAPEDDIEAQAELVGDAMPKPYADAMDDAVVYDDEDDIEVLKKVAAAADDAEDDLVTF